eukprot:TRINITY_DN22179_c0_g3_i1.p1 TRINITY_DN22179_c0_g3~~TRINITY_DN22179_c0_g3_i1.p1  ORF type:complete len:964 (-),score=161.37 TRINITY_DN22179_c0_g3_i1:82-2973(-)
MTSPKGRQAWDTDGKTTTSPAPLAQVLPAIPQKEKSVGELIDLSRCGSKTEMGRADSFATLSSKEKSRRLSAPGVIQSPDLDLDCGIKSAAASAGTKTLQKSRSDLCLSSSLPALGCETEMPLTTNHTIHFARNLATEADECMERMETSLVRIHSAVPFLAAILFLLTLLAARVPLDHVSPELAGPLRALEGVTATLFVLLSLAAFLARWPEPQPRGLGKVAWMLGDRGANVICGLLTYVACTMMSFSAPSRRLWLLGLDATGASDAVFCEEGATTQWTALVLGFAAVSRFLPFEVFAPLSQLICLQQLVISLLLRRPECDAAAGAVGGVGGPLFGLPPAAVTALQLHLLAAQFAAASWRLRADAAVVRIVSRLIDVEEGATTNGDGENGKTSRFSVKTSLELFIEELTSQETRIRELTVELAQALPTTEASYACVNAWVSMANIVEHTVLKLQGQSSALTSMRSSQAMALLGPQRHSQQGEVNAKRVARFLQQSFMNDAFSDSSTEAPSIANTQNETQESQDQSPLGNGNPFDDEDKLGRSYSRLMTIKGRREELNIGEWSFNAAQVEADHGTVLQVVGFELLSKYSVLRRDRLVTFLGKLEDGYEKNIPYHTHVHAADVCNAIYYIFTKLGLMESTHFADTKRVSILLAALGHDLGHFGRNNHFLISTNHWLATTYNDRSVLESFHTASLFRILDADRGQDFVGGIMKRSEGTKLLADFPSEDYKKTRQLIIALILATDTQSHFEALAEFRLRLNGMESDAHGGHGPDAKASFDPVENMKDQQELMCMLFRAADIGHSAKEWELHEMWSIKVTDEFFLQGDEERRLGLPISPLCERKGFVLANSQVGFLQFVCVPTWTAVARYEALAQNAERHGKVSMIPTKSHRRRSSAGTDISSHGRLSQDRLSLTGEDDVVHRRLSQGGALKAMTSVCLALCESNLQEWTERKAQAQAQASKESNEPA